MSMIKKLQLLIATSLFLYGCSTANIQKYESIDTSSKSITVPAGGSGLKGDIKQALKADGWKMSIMQGPQVYEKKSASITQSYNTFNTRYTLLLASSQFDTCIGEKMFEPAESFDISVIDNKSGSEVFTMSGEGCNSKTVKSFMQTMQAE